MNALYIVVSQLLLFYYSTILCSYISLKDIVDQQGNPCFLEECTQPFIAKAITIQSV